VPDSLLSLFLACSLACSESVYRLPTLSLKCWPNSQL